MIGQKNLQKCFAKMKSLPKAALLIGVSGSGKRTFAKEQAYRVDITAIMAETGVESIREIVEDAYNVVDPIVYIIPDVDKMSIVAQNTLLKVIEEPPKNVYFILTSSSDTLVLATIYSRCKVYHMDMYSPEELCAYLYQNYPKFSQADVQVKSICECPGDVDLLLTQGKSVEEFTDYVQLVYDNIATTSGANSFKIADKIGLKDDKGYDLRLFWKCFMIICMDHIQDNPQKSADGVKITSKYLQDLRVSGINKQMLFDNWILEIRKAWL